VSIWNVVTAWSFRDGPGYRIFRTAHQAAKYPKAAIRIREVRLCGRRATPEPRDRSGRREFFRLDARRRGTACVLRFAQRVSTPPPRRAGATQRTRAETFRYTAVPPRLTHETLIESVGTKRDTAADHCNFLHCISRMTL
jgi:hypothetical protein